ncbi:MAG: hypothetical protein HFI90_11895 [Clostridia bacterium]|nr:hypothetical protein [Clostridia bacterium]
MRRHKRIEYRTPIHRKRYILLALILSGITAYCAWGFGEPQREKDRYCRKSENFSLRHHFRCYDLLFNHPTLLSAP